jgi:hypothetical protein
MVEAVSHCTSSRSVMEKLDKLPPRLDVLYDEALKRIDMQPEEHAALAQRVLLWVAYAFRPLTVEELRCAVSSHQKANWGVPEDLVPESLMLSVCCGLVVIEEEWHSVGGSFRLVRQSPFYSC